MFFVQEISHNTFVLCEFLLPFLFFFCFLFGACIQLCSELAPGPVLNDPGKAQGSATCVSGNQTRVGSVIGKGLIHFTVSPTPTYPHFPDYCNHNKTSHFIKPLSPEDGKILIQVSHSTIDHCELIMECVQRPKLK